MNKVLLFSDIHIATHKRKTERLNDCLNVLDWVFQTAEKNNIENIIFGGDLFHDRQKIEIFAYQKTYEIIRKWLNTKKFNLYLLLGNHDLWFNEKTNISSVIPFSDISNIRVISEVERIKIDNHNWDFIPFTHDPIVSIKKLNELDGKKEYAIGHLAIDGAKLHTNVISDVVIEHDGDMVVVKSEIFKGYKHVFLGHYHASQKLDANVEYIGSPLQLSFGEAFQEKHLIIFDQDKKECEYILNDFSPKHLIIKSEDIDKHDLENNFVRVSVNDISSLDVLNLKKEIISENKLGSLEIKQVKENLSEHKIDNAKSILSKGSDMLKEYIKVVPHEGLDDGKLLEIGNIICSESN